MKNRAPISNVGARTAHIDSYSALKTLDSDRDFTVRLARWSAAFLASSMVLLFGGLAILFMVADLRGWVAERPVGSALLVVFILGYIVSFICLHRIQKTRSSQSLRLWTISLVGAAMPLAVLAYCFDASAAVFIVGMAEVAAILLHVVAILIILKRLSSPDTSLDRARKR